LVLDGLSLTTLSPAPPLSGVVSQSLSNLGSHGSLPIEGKDYVLSSVRYFDNQTYAVAQVKPLNQVADPGSLVLQQINGTYRVILGPGTAFSSVDTQELPNDVVQYLKSQALIYEPVD
jgi:ABC-type xylose transport system substrate-binding protein